MDYVSGPKEEACFFCAAIESTDDAGNLVVARRPHALAILNRYPYNSGHVMIAPLRHVALLADLSADERLGIMDLLTETVGVLDVEMRPDGCNVGINLGRAAGAGVPGRARRGGSGAAEGAAGGGGGEFVVPVSGGVGLGPRGRVNATPPTGGVEVVAESIEILAGAAAPPLQIDEHAGASEETRLRY